MRYIQPLQPSQLGVQTPKVSTKSPTQSFNDILQQQATLKVSKHAIQRLDQRKIDIDSKQWQQITDKVLEAKQKGVQEPLVVLDKAALIISAKNMTVITAMSRDEAKNQIFTNIDGTIILN